MPSVALVTCTDLPAGLDRAFVGSVDAPLAEALATHGVTVEAPGWRDPDVDWSAFDVAVVRTTWDYGEHRDAFVDWAVRVARETALYNPADVLRWNTHKSYLLELEERGAPVVPTAWLGAGDRVELTALLRMRDWPRAVVKPAVGAGSTGLRRVDARDATDLAAAQAHLDGLLATGDALVQPYQASVEARGELSVMVIDGQVTHAMRKIPDVGDFRVQREFGARVVREEPPDQAARLATWVVEATGADLLFARVDLLEDAVGALQVIELEATEPDLHLRDAPDAARTLAGAIVARLPGRPRSSPATS
jgi:glutathione synthase/RimK-type ligase-like ATP-grasp enzyme